MKELDIYISGIYCLYNKITRKRYVGQAIVIQSRVNDHAKSLRKGTHYNLKLQNTFNKYGPKIWKVQILEEVVVYGNLKKKKVRKRLNRKLTVAEQFWIDYYDSYDNGYNARPIANSPLGTTHITSEETRRKLSKANKGQNLGGKLSLKTREKISKGLEDRPVSKTTRKRLSKAQKGKKRRKHTKAEKKKISKALRGRKKSSSHIQHLKEVFATKKYRKKHRKAMQKVFDDPRVHEKMSVSGKKAWQGKKGKKRRKNQKKKFKGKGNPFYGKHHSKATKQEISESKRHS